MELQAQLISPASRRFLQAGTAFQIQSLFARVCNLVTQQGELFSLVTPSVGIGPFALMTAEEINFLHYAEVQNPVQVFSDTIRVSTLIINLTKVTLWEPRPEWGSITAAQIQKYQPLIEALLAPHDYFNLQLTDFPHWSAAVLYAAGRGNGLTPAGDDFLLGMMLALWAFLPPQTAAERCAAIAQLAAPRTTTLSAAWLKAAQRGEAQLSWHNLVEALKLDQPAAVERALTKILDYGHTSGADALSGFHTTIRAILTKQLASDFWYLDN